ncbi:hypothetical protein Tco_0776276 [Tanacetum coccineum]
MPNESKLLKMFDKLDEAILALRRNIDVTLLKDERRIYIDDGQNTLRQFYKTDVIPMSLSLIKRSKELTEEVQEITKKNEILILEKEKISSNSKDIQANLLKRIKILENDFKRSQAQSIDFELKLQHQKEKMAYDNSWKSKLTKLSDENVKTIKKGKNMNTKFDKSETLRKFLCITPLKTNTTIKAKKVSNSEVKANRSKSVTSHSTRKKEQTQKQSANIIARGIKSSNSVKRSKSNDTKSKNRVVKNTNFKSPSSNDWKVSSNVSVDIFMLSHEKCVARYALSVDSGMKRALFTSPVAAISRNLGAT